MGVGGGRLRWWICESVMVVGELEWIQMSDFFAHGNVTSCMTESILFLLLIKMMGFILLPLQKGALTQPDHQNNLMSPFSS